MSYDNILLEKRGAVALLTVNRPQKLNALSSSVLTEIAHAVFDFTSDRSAGAMIVTGAGEKAFVAGADIEELSGLDAAGGKAFSEHGQEVLDRIETAEKIVATILSKGPIAIRYALEAIRRGCEMSQNEALGLEAALFGLCFATEDMKEGTAAFKDKRKASFKGR